MAGFEPRLFDKVYLWNSKFLVFVHSQISSLYCQKFELYKIKSQIRDRKRLKCV